MLNIGEFARLGQVSRRMLRHYDELGLLPPERVDADSGYRSYSVHQLGRLHRIVALRDIGFGLDQIREILSQDISVEELRGMLRLRRAQIEKALGEEQDRLRRVEAHLRALEWRDLVELQDIVIKRTEPLRIARASAGGLSHADIGAAFGRLLPQVIAHLEALGAKPGISVGVYEDDGGAVPEGEIMLHAGFSIGEQDVPDSETVRVVQLPTLEVAAAVYRGGDDGIMAAWEALARWIDDSGYRLGGRLPGAVPRVGRGRGVQQRDGAPTAHNSLIDPARPRPHEPSELSRRRPHRSRRRQTARPLRRADARTRHPNRPGRLGAS